MITTITITITIGLPCSIDQYFDLVKRLDRPPGLCSHGQDEAKASVVSCQGLAPSFHACTASGVMLWIWVHMSKSLNTNYISTYVVGKVVRGEGV